MNWEEIGSTIMSWIMNTGLKIVIAIIVLLIAFRLINVITRKLQKKAEAKGKLDSTLARVLFNVIRIVAKILVVVCLVGYLGFDTSGIAALIASLGVAVGLAVNGALGNIAGGILILVTRPFKIGDFIECAGYTGTVEDIRLCATKLTTLDNRVIIIPNGTASGSTVVNYSVKDLRRVDQTFSISYQNDFGKAKEILAAIMNGHEKVLKDPAPFVRVSAQGTSSIDLTTRAWVKAEDYWTVYFDMLEQVKARFDAEGIHIPYQQLDVHVKQD